jgi:hypothetical protein
MGIEGWVSVVRVPTFWPSAPEARREVRSATFETMMAVGKVTRQFGEIL